MGPDVVEEGAEGRNGIVEGGVENDMGGGSVDVFRACSGDVDEKEGIVGGGESVWNVLVGGGAKALELKDVGGTARAPSRLAALAVVVGAAAEGVRKLGDLPLVIGSDGAGVAGADKLAPIERLSPKNCILGISTT